LAKFGKNTYSREQADLDFLMTRLHERTLPFSDRFDLERIALLGHSRGGGNSILYASEHPEFKAVVTWNGIADADLFDETFRKEVLSKGIGYVKNARTKQEMPIESSFFEDLDRNAARFNIIDAIAKLPIPVLTVQGDRDSDRLVKGHDRLRKASPNQEHFVISGANHTFGAVHPFNGPTEHLNSAIELTVNFLDKHVVLQG
jgi:pimeloyl-ACP methyl ester carboxylesterase